MKPITSILLVLALICYVFLPFYDIAFQGSITGFSYTAGTITQFPSVRHIAFALLPFISCFLAIGVNTLKDRRWGIVTAILIFGILFFFARAYNFHEIALTHSPDVKASEGIGEGFSIVGLGIGFKASCVLSILAIISAIVSIFPFAFNTTLEKAVDDTIDRSLEDMKAIGTRVSKDVKDWQTKYHRPKTASAPAETKTDGQPVPPPADAAPADQPAPPPVDPEDPSRFMPK